MVELIHADITKEIIGSAFAVYNELGFGHFEKTYQKAIAEEFIARGIPFKREFFVSVFYRGKQVGRNFFDFLVLDKVIVELKQGNHFSISDIKQVHRYLVSLNLELGILVLFTDREVRIKRVVNLNPSNQYICKNP